MQKTHLKPLTISTLLLAITTFMPLQASAADLANANMQQPQRQNMLEDDGPDEPASVDCLVGATESTQGVICHAEDEDCLVKLLDEQILYGVSYEDCRLFNGEIVGINW